MNKVKEIIISWARSINPTPEQERIAEIRLKVCMGCEAWAENMAGIQYCRKCGCNTKKKVFTPKTVEDMPCPMNKWPI